MDPKVNSTVDNPELIRKRIRQFVTSAISVFGKNGFHKTTIKQIAQHAGVSSGLLYSYVKSKEELLYLALHHLLETYARDIPKALEGIEDPIERFYTATRVYCEIVAKNPSATVLAYRETKSLPKEHQGQLMKMELETNALIIDTIEAAMEQGLFREVNSELVAYRIVLLAHGWALKGWFFKKKISFDDYVNEGIDLFVNALCTDKGWKHLESRGWKAPLKPSTFHPKE